MPDTPPKVERKQCNVRLPVDLIAEIDARRQKKDLSRDAWVERAIRYAIANAPKPQTGPRRPIPTNR